MVDSRIGNRNVKARVDKTREVAKGCFLKGLAGQSKDFLTFTLSMMEAVLWLLIHLSPTNLVIHRIE